MNSQIEAMGAIATFTHSLDGKYSGWTTERGNYMASVEFGEIVLSVHAEPLDEYVTAFTDRMLSRVDGFSHTRQSVEIVNAEELNELGDQLETSAVSLTTLTEPVDGTSILTDSGQSCRCTSMMTSAHSSSMSV